MSFYTDKRGRRINRKPGGPSKEQVATLASCARLREHNSEFGGVSAMVGRIRTAFGLQLNYFSEGTYFNRLMGLLKMVLDTDGAGKRGERQPLGGHVQLLEGFEWNNKLSFANALGAEYSSYIDVAGGKMVVEIGSFGPGKLIRAPEGSTHFKIIVRGAVLGGEREGMRREMSETRLIKIDKTDTGPLRLELDVNTGKDEQGLMILGAGIIFYEEIEGIPFALRGLGCFCLLNVERMGVTKKEDAALRKSAIAKLEELMRVGKLRAAIGVPGIHGEDDPELEGKLVMLEKKLWTRRMERLRGY